MAGALWHNALTLFGIVHYAGEVMKRIVILSAFLTPYRSGAEACAEEIPSLLADDFSFTIITARMSRTLPVHDHLGKIPVHRVGFGSSFDKWLFPFLAPFAARQYKPQIVHAVLESFAGMALVFSKRMIPAVHILTCQSTNTSLLLALMHRKADRVTCISSVLMQRAARFGRTDAVLIPNGIHLQAIQQACASQKKIPGRLLFVGRLEPMKGVATLLDAFMLMAPRYPDATLHVVGDGSLRRTLETRHPYLVKSGRIVFRGYQPPLSVYHAYAEAEIFCALSGSEALGNVFLEAQAAGCAIVATNVGGIPDTVKDGETGLLVPPHDTEAAALALERLIADDALRARLAAHAVNNAAQYDWSVIAKQYRAVYDAA